MRDNDYADRQTARDAEAARIYRELGPSLDPAVRAILAKGDEITPDDSMVGNHSAHDVSEMPLTAPEEDLMAQAADFAAPAENMADTIDTEGERLAEPLGITPAQADAVLAWHRKVVEREMQAREGFLLARVVGYLILPGNVKLRIMALAFAAGIARSCGLVSMSQAAGQCGVSRSMMSKEFNRWLDELGLPRLEGKSQAARQIYSEAQKANHWRTRRRNDRIGEALADGS